MSDRTWNQIDARIYEEGWSQEAVLIAVCLLVRCPNQYGIFDKPIGFLTMFFRGLYTIAQIESVLTELEGANFLKLYRDGNVIWIRSKWKRAGRPSALHWKGAQNHLESYNEVRKDFLSYYKAHWKGIESPLKGDGIPIESSGYPPVNPESESESKIKDKIKLHCPAKNAGRKKNRKREKKTPSQIWYEFFLIEFEKRKGHAPTLKKSDVINVHKQHKSCARIHDERTIRSVTKYYLDRKDDCWKGHKPHVMFNNFDRLLEGMMEYQGKREQREKREHGISDSQAAWEREQADMQNNPEEIPEEYRLTEATPDDK